MRKLVLPLLALVLATAALIQVAGPAAGAVGAITDSSWALSNQKPAATGVQYKYSFKTVTAGSIKTITFEVLNSAGAAATGFAGTPTIVLRTGIGAGTVARAVNKITYTVTSAASIPAGRRINLTFGGVTSPTLKSNYTTRITTVKSPSGNIDQGSTAPTYINGAVCSVGQAPSEPASASSLKVACLFAPSALATSTTITDYTNAVYQWGAARQVTATWGAVPTSTITITGGSLGAGLSDGSGPQPTDVNHSIEGTDGGGPGVAGIPAGDFIVGVSGTTATLAYPITADTTPSGTQTVLIANTTARSSQNDGMLNATTNCRDKAPAQTGDANLYVCSATANFTAADMGKTIGGDAIPDGDTISTAAGSVTSYAGGTRAKLTNGVPGAPSPAGTVATSDFSIASGNPSTSTRSIMDATNPSGSTICSTTAQFGAQDIGLPVQNGTGQTNIAAGSLITSVVALSAPPCSTGQTGAVLNNAPSGALGTCTGAPAVCAETVVGLPLATATANGEVVGATGINFVVNPAVSPGSPPCSANKVAGFVLPLLWHNPGAMHLVDDPSGVPTKDYSRGGDTGTSTGQFLVQTGPVVFAGFLKQTMAAGKSTWKVIFPNAPIALGVCSGTNVEASYEIAGLSETNVTRINTPNGATGPPGTGLIRAIFPPVCTTTNATATNPSSPAYAGCTNTPAAGVTGTASVTTSNATNQPTVLSACTVPSPAALKWVQPNAGATGQNAGFPCGNG